MPSQYEPIDPVEQAQDQAFGERSVSNIRDDLFGHRLEELFPTMKLVKVGNLFKLEAANFGFYVHMLGDDSFNLQMVDLNNNAEVIDSQDGITQDEVETTLADYNEIDDGIGEGNAKIEDFTLHNIEPEQHASSLKQEMKDVVSAMLFGSDANLIAEHIRAARQFKHALLSECDEQFNAEVSDMDTNLLPDEMDSNMSVRQKKLLVDILGLVMNESNDEQLFDKISELRQLMVGEETANEVYRTPYTVPQKRQNKSKEVEEEKNPNFYGRNRGLAYVKHPRPTPGAKDAVQEMLLKPEAPLVLENMKKLLGY